MDPSTIYRTVKLFEETGTVCSVQGCHENTGKKLSRSDEIGILELVLEHPSMYLHELQNPCKTNLQVNTRWCKILQVALYLAKCKITRFVFLQEHTLLQD